VGSIVYSREMHTHFYTHKHKKQYVIIKTNPQFLYTPSTTNLHIIIK
jgi:hypothetical protein